MNIQRPLPLPPLILLLLPLTRRLRPAQNHRPIKVDNLVVQPLPRAQTRQIRVADLLPGELGDDAALAEQLVDERLVLGRERGGEGRALGAEAGVDALVALAFPALLLFVGGGEGDGFGSGWESVRGEEHE